MLVKIITLVCAICGMAAAALAADKIALAKGGKALAKIVVAPAVLEPAHDGHPAVFDWTPSAATILGRAHNMPEGLKDATAHAEMLAMSAAFAVKCDWRLTGARLYVTKEPCPMCAGGIVLARLDAVVWGVSDPKRGGGTTFGIFGHPGINHHPEVVTGVLEEESKAILQSFFRARRATSS